MTMTLTSSSRTVTLPAYARDGLDQPIAQNFAKNYPLQGNLYVDFFNIRSGWNITFDVITAEEYGEIRAIFDDQFTNGEFLVLNDTDIPVVNQSVFLNLPSSRSLAWNKQVVKDLTISLEPENADS